MFVGLPDPGYFIMSSNSYTLRHLFGIERRLAGVSGHVVYTEDSKCYSQSEIEHPWPMITIGPSSGDEYVKWRSAEINGSGLDPD